MQSSDPLGRHLRAVPDADPRFTFGDLQAFTPEQSEQERIDTFDALPAALRVEAWDHAGLQPRLLRPDALDLAEQSAADVRAADVAVRWTHYVLCERRRRRAARPVRPAHQCRSDDLHDALLAIPADEWLPALTGIDMPRSRMVNCPLPGHEDRTPSCRLYERTYYCFGCHRGGDIFNFAGELWEIPTRSRNFPELRERLADHLLGAVAA